MRDTKMYQDSNPYAVSSDMFAVDAALSERLGFLRKVYVHVFGAILLLIGLEFLYFNTPLADSIMSLFGRRTWWIALIGFMAVTWIANSLAFSGARPSLQYFGLGMFTLAESVFTVPAIYLANRINADLIGQAAFLTLLITGGLTLFVVISKADFSFLRNFLFVGGIAILAIAVLSMFGLFGGFQIGTVISGGIVLLMCGYILYETSLIMHHLPTTAHVAGALMIFGSIAQLFRHILYLLMRFSDD